MTPPRPAHRIAPLTTANRAEVAGLLARAADYYHLWLGRPPGEAEVEDVFSSAPPGCEAAASVRLGLWLPVRDGQAAPDGLLSGVAELSFGFPEAGDAYLGLMILDPAARGRGLGAAFHARVLHHAAARGATRIFLGVLEANVAGARFWAAQGYRPTGLSREDAETGHRLHRLGRAVPSDCDP